MQPNCCHYEATRLSSRDTAGLRISESWPTQGPGRFCQVPSQRSRKTPSRVWPVMEFMKATSSALQARRRHDHRGAACPLRLARRGVRVRSLTTWPLFCVGRDLFAFYAIGAGRSEPTQLEIIGHAELLVCPSVCSMRSAVRRPPSEPTCPSHKIEPMPPSSENVLGEFSQSGSDVATPERAEVSSCPMRSGRITTFSFPCVQVDVLRGSGTLRFVCAESLSAA